MLLHYLVCKSQYVVRQNSLCAVPYQLQRRYGICRVCRIGARTAAYQQTRSQQHSATPNACRVTGLSTADCKLRRWPPVAPWRATLSICFITRPTASTLKGTTDRERHYQPHFAVYKCALCRSYFIRTRFSVS